MPFAVHGTVAHSSNLIAVTDHEVALSVIILRLEGWKVRIDAIRCVGNIDNEWSFADNIACAAAKEGRMHVEA
jgi:hypothetical protein